MCSSATLCVYFITVEAKTSLLQLTAKKWRRVTWYKQVLTKAFMLKPQCLPLKTTCVWTTESFLNVLCPGPGAPFYTFPPLRPFALRFAAWQPYFLHSRRWTVYIGIGTDMALVHNTFSKPWFSPLLVYRDLTLGVLATDKRLIGVVVEYGRTE